MKRLITGILISGFVAFHPALSQASVPLNNLEGVGGIAFNPLAYTAGTSFEEGEGTIGSISLKGFVNKPQFGVWYVNLDRVDVDWTALSVADTLFNRLELSYGYETIAPVAKNIHKNNVGAKFLLLKENYNGIKFLPAVSLGTIYKHASNVSEDSGIDAAGFDYYLVATKLITQLPKPVLVSAGVLSTKGRVTGVFGFDRERDEAFFGNIDILPLKNVAVGFEYKQGAHFKDFKNANYWDAHVAWFVNKNLTLVAAYVDAGDYQSTRKVGLGDGVVLSAQYAF
jgi:hypothetical protein